MVISLGLVVGLRKKGKGAAGYNGLDESDSGHYPKDVDISTLSKISRKVSICRAAPARQIDNSPQPMDAELER